MISEYIGIRPGYCGGEPHILGHRITVKHIAVWHEGMGMSPGRLPRLIPPSRWPKSMPPWPIIMIIAMRSRRRSPRKIGSSKS